MTNRAPLFLAIVLLLLPVLYVGSYLALVVPEGIHIVCMSGKPSVRSFIGHYWADQRIAGVVFWPLEQIDRKVRPSAWRGKKIGLQKQQCGSNWQP